MNKINDALNAISQLSQASDYLLGNLLRVTEEFPKESLVRDPSSTLYTPSTFDVIGGTVIKEYHQGARPTYRMRWHLDDTAWRTLAEALTALPGRESIVAGPIDGYVRLSFDYEGHEFMCLMPRERAEHLGYIEPKEG